MGNTGIIPQAEKQSAGVQSGVRVLRKDGSGRIMVAVLSPGGTPLNVATDIGDRFWQFDLEAREFVIVGVRSGPGAISDAEIVDRYGEIGLTLGPLMSRGRQGFDLSPGPSVARERQEAKLRDFEETRRLKPHAKAAEDAAEFLNSAMKAAVAKNAPQIENAMAVELDALRAKIEQLEAKGRKEK